MISNEELKKRVNIIDVIENYEPIFEDYEGNFYSCCPFHNIKSDDDDIDTLRLLEDKQIYQCSVCGATGDVLDYIINEEKVSLDKAVEILKEFINRDLDRFVMEQKRDYNQALKEIKSGRKLTHWIWYIFPQIKGLGKSYNSIYFGIKDLYQAREYLKNDYLRNNLIEISQALLDLDSNNPTEVLGYPDDLKVKSCMTLFYYADSSIDVFKKVIDKYYNGEFDTNTISLVGK